ncbi:MarR family winged helix-turn-helix transcriptional regulator [Saccharopolyspora phatthalungensis]|uniref:DNA-binding MarR family transcriptional regulator n=1 Tax=Saccharopolyspora phatthalungensis TaxID=664693 RepID=A0A840Q970_9PSEU|nr:MarR family transcriptional regulator [Saccharopolyspora phatthalungensis]MBB5156996.1 DNA-binding MarR family transcriptional regulator [Saccharopolyspora phatthalungensis]
MAHPPEAHPNTAAELGVQLVRLVRLIHRVKSQTGKKGPDGIEQSAYAILFHLVQDGPQRTGRLAESLHSEISTISRQSNALVQHGLVERQADPNDGRACLLAPTAEGQRIFREAHDQRTRWLAEVLADWSQADRLALNSLFARLNTDIETRTPNLAEPACAPQAKGGHA